MSLGLSNPAMRAIVQREMQVAARRRATYLFRSLTAGIGLLIAGIVFGFGDEIPSPGRVLFWAIAIAGCFLAVREGAHRASVSLTEERANGTLGLLFLTSLKGFDIVMGKFVSVSFLSFQLVLVLVPAMYCTILLGGVSFGEIARASLCVANTTFVFIAACMLFSSLTASEVAAIVMAVVTVTMTLLAGLFEIETKWFVDHFGFRFDPITTWNYIPDSWFHSNPTKFWLGLLISHASGWLLLRLCGHCLQRTWSRPEVFPKLSALWTRRPRIPKAKGPTKILGMDGPLEWLTLRNLYRKAPLAVVIAATFISAFYLLNGEEEGGFVVAFTTMVLLALGVTTHATLAVARARKSGILELVAVAPISNFEIIAGQIRGLRRAFLMPILIAAFWICLFIEWNQMFHPINEFETLWARFGPLYYVASYFVALWAACYMGIWMALKQKGPARAVMRTIFLTLVLPWILPAPNALYWFILGNVARQSVRTDFRDLLMSRTAPPPPFPTITG